MRLTPPLWGLVCLSSVSGWLVLAPRSTGRGQSCTVMMSGKGSGGYPVAPSSRPKTIATKREGGSKSGGGGGFGKKKKAAPTSVVAEQSHLGPEWKGFKFAGSIRPMPRGLDLAVPPPPQVRTFPDYAVDGVPKLKGPKLPWVVEVKTQEEIAGMRAAGRCAREVLDLAGKLASVPGTTTDDINRLVHAETISRGAYPSPLNYCGFPRSVCTSVNEVICHGIPDATVLKEGDIINVDVTCYLDGFHGDCSETFGVGAIDDQARRLIQATYDAWVAAMDYCQPGRHYQGVGGVIEDVVAKLGFSTVKQFCGHGVGRVFHTTPNVLHYRNLEPNGVMAAGHTFTIEPMICEGSNKVLQWPDNWTATTADGKRSAQFEHTLLLTPSGVVALTAKTKDSPLYFQEKGAPFVGKGAIADLGPE